MILLKIENKKQKKQKNKKTKMEPRAKRCQCINVTNKKICAIKSKNLTTINNKKYCKLHMIYYQSKYALIIQKWYKGFRHRKLLKNIYKKLPTDLQSKIIFHVRQDFHYKKYISILTYIVNVKLIYYLLDVYHHSALNVLTEYVCLNTNYIENICKLFNKYHRLVRFYVRHLMKTHLPQIRLAINEFEIYDQTTTYVYNIMDLLYYKMDAYIYPRTILSSES